MGKRPRTRQRVFVEARRNPRLRAALSMIQRRVRELTEEKEAVQSEIAELRRIVTEQAEYLETLAARVEPTLNREDDLRAMLLSAHEQLMRRADEVQTTLAAQLHKAAAQQNAPEQNTPAAQASIIPPNQSFLPGEYGDYQKLSKHIYYQRLIRRIREVVSTALPLESTVIVVSKGDDELLKLGDGRRGWHFPQSEDGVYAGYYPADSAQAVSHLEELRAKGGEFLLFPGTALWWLEHYGKFKQYLESNYRVVVRQEDTCIIFALREPEIEQCGTVAQGNGARTAARQEDTPA